MVENISFDLVQLNSTAQGSVLNGLSDTEIIQQYCSQNSGMVLFFAIALLSLFMLKLVLGWMMKSDKAQNDQSWMDKLARWHYSLSENIEFLTLAATVYAIISILFPRLWM